ncbi:MAG: hypothetical protein ACREXN_01115 [Polaromonas sp.]
MNPIASFKVNGRDINLFGCRYSVGPARWFVLATDEGEPFGTVTVNVPGYPLADDEVLVKTWEENAPARQPLLNSGVFSDTGKRVPCGYVEAEVWKLLPTKLM